MRTYRVRAAAAAVGASLMLLGTACSPGGSDSAKPEPLPVADPSTSQAVEQAVRTLFSSVGPAYVSGDPSALQRASTPACELCGAWQQAVRILAEQKVSVKPDDVDMKVLSVTNVRAGSGRAEADAMANSAESAPGSPRRDLPYRVRLVQQDNQWLVDGLSPAGPPPSQ